MCDFGVSKLTANAKAVRNNTENILVAYRISTQVLVMRLTDLWVDVKRGCGLLF